MIWHSEAVLTKDKMPAACEKFSLELPGFVC